MWFLVSKRMCTEKRERRLHHFAAPGKNMSKAVIVARCTRNILLLADWCSPKKE
jgi:hypothetical protein